MIELRFATFADDADNAEEDCSWSKVIHGIERYAAYHPVQASDLHEWADLLEGIRQLREGA
jgi:hypothetical protein